MQDKKNVPLLGLKPTKRHSKINIFTLMHKREMDQSSFGGGHGCNWI
jgi:hypothetical protein